MKKSKIKASPNPASAKPAPAKPKTRHVYCPDCRTRCRQVGYSLKTFQFRCASCNKNIDIPMSREEKRYSKWLMDEMWRKSANLHGVWHKFQKHFFKRERREITLGDKVFKGWDYTEWRWLGYELMKRVSDYALKHPEIVVTGCDNDHFMNSDLVLIPHRNEEGYMGTTVIYIDQNGHPPAQFFLYPGHESGLLQALKQVKAKK